MKQTDTHLRYIEAAIHIIGWGIVFGFPYMMMSRSGVNLTWGEYLRHGSIVPLTFFIVFYANYLFLIPRYLFGGRTKEYILINILLIACLAFGSHLWQEYTFRHQPPGRPGQPFHIGPPKWLFLLRDAFSMVLTVGLSTAIRLSRRWTQIEDARREAEKSRTEAELKNLRSQLNPHFLLNTLNNIYALIAFDADKAQAAVQELSCLLRHVLYENQQQTVTLDKEMDFNRNYIDRQPHAHRAPHLHLADRECLQAWHLAHRTQLHPHPVQREGRADLLRHHQQLSSQDTGRQERQRHRPGAGPETAGTVLRRPIHLAAGRQ